MTRASSGRAPVVASLTQASDVVLLAAHPQGRDAKEDEMDLEKAIGAHVEWKTKFRGAIAAQTQFDAGAVGKDNVCPLGQWLHGEARAKYGKLTSYTSCVRGHAAFHLEAGKVARLINSRQYSEAEAALGGDTPYYAASTEIGVAIARLRKEIGA
jgi:hypothetical protein